MEHPPAPAPAPVPVGRGRARARAAAAALVVIGLLVGAVSTSADQITDKIQQKQGQSNQIGSMITSLQQTITQLQDHEAQLQAAIAALDTQIAAQEQKIATAQTQLQQLADQLTAEQAKLDDARARLRADKTALAEQVVAIYKMGDDSAINNLLSADNFNQFWQRFIDLRRVAGGQKQVVDRVRSEQDSIQQQVDQISQQKQQQAQMLAQLNSEQDALQQQRAERARTMLELQVVQQQDQQQLQQWKAAEQQLEAEINQLKAEEAAALAAGGGNGHFVWPEQGPITQGFGCTPYSMEPYDPNCPSRHFHSGIDIGAAYGTPVHAGDAGIAHLYVSDYGYGDHVIIDHGNGWVSVYGHLSGFAVGDGQTVGRYQVIGYEGSTGNSTGPHLHFEVRLNGVPQNPLAYLS